MIDSKSLLLTVLYICGTAVAFSILQYFGVRSIFYLWEITVDLKLAAIGMFLLLLFVTGKFSFDLVFLKISTWNWQSVLFYFFLPVILSAVVIGLGLAIGIVTPNSVENKLTLFLATVFDIPAIFVFSATTILFEEIIFRSIFFKSILLIQPDKAAIMSSSILWAIYNFLGIVDFNQITAGMIVTVFCSQFVAGIFLSILMLRYNSIWTGYSFRIGIGVVSSLFLKSIITDTDPFFTTDSVFFPVEGWIFSLLLFIGAYWLYSSTNKLKMMKY